MHKILLAMLIIVMLGAVSPARSQPIQVTDVGIGFFDSNRTDQLTIIERRTSATVDEIYRATPNRNFGGWIAIGVNPLPIGHPYSYYKWRYTKPSGEQTSLMGPYGFYTAGFGTFRFNAPGFERNPNGTWTFEFFVWDRDAKVDVLVATRSLQVTSTTPPDKPPPTVTPPGTMPPTGTAPSFWNPYQRRTVRDGSGNWQTTIAPGANAWWASGGALSFQGTGNNTYIEDFVQSGTPYRVEGIQISFELQATVATTQGYVGPYVLLTNAGAGWQDPAGIGAQVFYNWESRGTRGGFLQRGGGGVDRKDLVVPGVNDGRFARHTITVVNGVVTWSADGKVLISGPLAHAAPSQLYLIVGTRMYDAGVAQSIRIRNLTVTEASPK